MLTKNKNQYSKVLERELTALEQNLLETLQERLGSMQQSGAGTTAEFMEAASKGELDEFAARIVEQDSIKIDEIEEALQRLREGQYGICTDCGGGISKKRLSARPFATKCIKCKERAEKEKNSYVEGGSTKNTPQFSFRGEASSKDPFDNYSIRGSKF